MKHKARLCTHGGMQQWGFNFLETYAQVENWISVRSLLSISCMHEFSSRSFDIVLSFPQADLDVDVLVDILLGMVFYVNKEEWILKLKKSLYGLKKSSDNWFDIL